ncbi:MAG: hypothetical protein L3J98_06840 [Gammaproteobacteria bacterium]|nr:hypothetical protein [Gammaproteobacteria bacterium]MCF6259863.1 hypothetical protein [Gammaproteobacteria bacterium]
MNDIGLLVGIGARSTERILVVLFAGLSVYFGFRLFLALPMQNNQAGKIELPGFKVILSKAGPGIFFAAFGSAVLVASFIHPISIDQQNGSYMGAVSPASPMPITSLTPVDDGSKAVQLAQVELALQTLNCLPAYAKAAQGQLLPSDIELTVRDAKLALLRTVWDDVQWGDYSEFVAWSRTGLSQTPKKIQALYAANITC